ncbi:CesT family type III secretion system chaperone, partial [Burkholderia ubonensis]
MAQVIYGILVNEWLQHLGLAKMQDISSKPVTINVDDRFDVHCCLANNEKLLLIAELPALSITEGVLKKALKENQPISQTMQPKIALRDGKYWQCWIDIPINGCNLPALVEGFNLVTQCVDRFLDGIST